MFLFVLPEHRVSSMLFFFPFFLCVHHISRFVKFAWFEQMRGKRVKEKIFAHYT